MGLELLMNRSAFRQYSPNLLRTFWHHYRTSLRFVQYDLNAYYAFWPHYLLIYIDKLFKCL